MKNNRGLAEIYLFFIVIIALIAAILTIAPNTRVNIPHVATSTPPAESAPWWRPFRDVAKKPPVAIPSGIHGTVKVGPVCPVVRLGDEAKCADKPYAITLSIKDAWGKELLRPTSDVNGKFEAELPPGTYTLSLAEPHAILPRMTNTTFTVVKGTYTDVPVTLDSGIR